MYNILQLKLQHFARSTTTARLLESAAARQREGLRGARHARCRCGHRRACRGSAWQWRGRARVHAHVNATLIKVTEAVCLLLVLPGNPRLIHAELARREGAPVLDARKCRNVREEVAREEKGGAVGRARGTLDRTVRAEVGHALVQQAGGESDLRVVHESRALVKLQVLRQEGSAKG